MIWIVGSLCTRPMAANGISGLRIGCSVSFAQYLRGIAAWRDSPRLAALWASLLISVIYFGVIAVKYPGRSWFIGADQSWYLKAAKALAAGNPDPSQHYYPPGYALLDAIFNGLTPVQPFIIGNFLCFLASFWIFIRICRLLTADEDKGQLLGVLAFIAATPPRQGCSIIRCRTTHKHGTAH